MSVQKRAASTLLLVCAACTVGPAPSTYPGGRDNLDGAVDVLVRSIWHPDARFRLEQDSGPGFDRSMPDIHQLLGSLEARFPQLQSALDSGTIALTDDGYVELRAPASLSVSDRTRLAALAANENSDRANLYRKLALTRPGSGEAEIRNHFAEAWITEASPGWYYRSGSSGSWLKK